MRRENPSIAPGYVASNFEIAFTLIVFLSIVFASFWLLSTLKDIPLLPDSVILESAYIYKGVSEASKTTSNLYLRVGSGDDAYNYILEVPTTGVRHLDLNKSRTLLVAVDLNKNGRFIWGVYDSDRRLMISGKDILQWTKSDNNSIYLIVLSWAILSLYLLLIIVRNGIWNRVLAKRKAHANRTN